MGCSFSNKVYGSTKQGKLVGEYEPCYEVVSSGLEAEREKNKWEP